MQRGLGSDLPSGPCCASERRRRKTSFQSLQEKLSVPFVVQFPYGSSGSSTFIIDNEKEYNALGAEYPSKRAAIREYLDGFSLNVNAVIVSHLLKLQ